MRETSNDAVVELRDISLDYGSHRILDGFNLTVRRGELVSLLGPSGSGKTTVIRALAGFLNPSGGQVLLSGRDVTGVPANKRGLGVVFQSYALFPHLSVMDNIGYPLKVRGESRSTIRRRCGELLELVQLTGQGRKRPAKLSGGQQQRVALARALAMDPEVLLLDEPLSNLDANLRRDVGEEIRRLQQSTGTTTIMVTHDRAEAFGMSDRIAVLRDGQIEQLGTPQELYRTPRTRFMAEFVGDANLIPGTVVDPTGDTTSGVNPGGNDDSTEDPAAAGTAGAADTGRLLISTPLGTLQATGTAPVGTEVEVLIRPEDLAFAAPQPAAGSQPGGHAERNLIAGVLKESFYYGSSVVAQVESGGTMLSMVASGSSILEPEVGSAVRLLVAPDNCRVLATGTATV